MIRGTDDPRNRRAEEPKSRRNRRAENRDPRDRKGVCIGTATVRSGMYGSEGSELLHRKPEACQL